jgi:hypothetical protein
MNTKEIIRRSIQLHILYVYCSLLALAIKYRFDVDYALLGVVAEIWLTWLLMFAFVVSVFVVKGAERADGLTDTPFHRKLRVIWNSVFCFVLGSALLTLFLMLLDGFFLGQ